MCTFAMRCMVEMAPSTGEMQRLNLYFGFKKILAMRGEHVFYHKLVLLVPELIDSERALDESVLSRLFGKAKCPGDPRPDYFHYFPNGLALHGEYDETGEHEDSDMRLRIIEETSGAAGVYVFRVQGHHYTPAAVCAKKVNGDYAYYDVTEEGMRVVREVAEAVRQRLQWIAQGLAPSAERPAKVYINF
jgi:hypothetical protein